MILCSLGNKGGLSQNLLGNATEPLTPCRMAFYFVSTFATAQTPTKQRPYGYRGLPALAFALHGW
ncbi:hypothetical protein BMETH_1295_0 [methanotrophic bacterial endosymbiont of Bathymodiolus sp.]|nr:hypothetical protein BMETH_1295_0 [methanotrophic bacterial endosymbiont of Bathymodiolus sp.]